MVAQNAAVLSGEVFKLIKVCKKRGEFQKSPRFLFFGRKIINLLLCLTADILFPLEIILFNVLYFICITGHFLKRPESQHL